MVSLGLNLPGSTNWAEVQIHWRISIVQHFQRREQMCIIFTGELFGEDSVRALKQGAFKKVSLRSLISFLETGNFNTSISFQILCFEEHTD